MRILSLILIVSTIASCQRQSDSDLPANPGTDNNNNQPGNDSIYLSKYAEIDTTLPVGQDTTIVYTFSYDAFKRIKNVKIVEYYSPTYVYNYDIDYAYQSNGDSLPYKVVEVDVEPAITYSETHYFTYNNGFVASDSGIWYRVTNNELLEKDLTLYTNSGNNTMVKTRDSVFATNNLFEHNGTVFKTYANNNITQQDDTTTISNSITGASHYQLGYDNNVNPFYKIDIRFPIYDRQGLAFTTGKNNITEEIAQDDLSNTFQNNKYTYTYRHDGYPLMVRKFDLLDAAENRTGFFFYTK